MAYYQQHMLSIKSRNTLAQLLGQMLLLNETIESYRQSLADTPYFDTLALFRFIDRQEKGYISQKDLHRVIGSTHRKLLTYGFTWMDNLKAGEISRMEFATFLLPRDNLELRELVAERVEHPEMGFSQKQTILQQFDIFREMVMEIMRREMKLIQLRRSLINSADYSIQGAILAIDSNRHDWVCSQDIYKYMKNHGFDVNIRQVDKLVEVLNYQVDGKITLQQLKWSVQGLEGKDKSYLNRIKQSNKKQPPKKPVNFQHNFSYHRMSNAQQYSQLQSSNPAQQVYNDLVSKLRSIQQNQKNNDLDLLTQEQLALEQTEKQRQRKRVELQFKRELEEKKRAQVREQLLMRKEMERQMEEMVTRTRILEEQSQRLKRLENKITIAADRQQIHRNMYDIVPKYPIQLTSSIRNPLGYPSRFNYIPQLQNNNPKENYQSKARAEAIQNHIQNSDCYLQAARKLRDRIKQEREVEKGIRDQFASNSIGKYGSYVKDVRSQSKVPGHIARKQSKQYEKQYELGINSNQKRKVQGSEMRPPVQVNLMASFGTPEAQINRSIGKFDYSTAYRGL